MVVDSESPERRFMNLYVSEGQQIYIPLEVNDFEERRSISDYMYQRIFEDGALIAKVLNERFAG